MRLFGMGCKHVWTKWQWFSQVKIMQHRECVSCGKGQSRMAR